MKRLVLTSMTQKDKTIIALQVSKCVANGIVMSDRISMRSLAMDIANEMRKRWNGKVINEIVDIVTTI